mgnify:CR=1 FL=1
MLLAATSFVALACAWWVGGQLVAARPCAIGAPPADLPAQDLSLVAPDGVALRGWYVPCERPRGVVVLLHGIGGSRLAMVDRARMLRAAGYALVMIDLRAHGESGGERISAGHFERLDARAAVEFARTAEPRAPIGVIGVSLGGAAALLASPLGIDALVLESVYPNITAAIHNRVAARLGWLSYVPAELLLLQLAPRLRVSPAELRPEDLLPRVGCPLLLISGSQDRHTPAQEARAMLERAPALKELWLVAGAAHVDLHRASPGEYRRRVLEFLDANLRPR